jgi:membrane protease YdiL (CAAX protease family)
VVRAVSPAVRAWRAAFLALAMAAWAAGFLVLRAAGTWLTFAIVGPMLAALASLLEPPPRQLLRGSPAAIAARGVIGAGWVVATHALFAVLAPRSAGARAEIARLFALLHASGLPLAGRAGLIAVIATCEEIVFRGALADPRGGIRVVALAAAYALPTTALGSGWLVACAFVCGLIWGGLRTGTRSLAPPIVAHLVWDLGVLVWWPLA